MNDTHSPPATGTATKSTTHVRSRRCRSELAALRQSTSPGAGAGSPSVVNARWLSLALDAIVASARVAKVAKAVDALGRPTTTR